MSLKRVRLDIAAAALLITLAGCATVERADAKKAETSMFVLVETANDWNVVYHRETKVMYAVSNFGYGSGVFTLLVNPDGTPMLYTD